LKNLKETLKNNIKNGVVTTAIVASLVGGVSGMSKINRRIEVERKLGVKEEMTLDEAYIAIDVINSEFKRVKDGFDTAKTKAYSKDKSYYNILKDTATPKEKK